LITTLLLREAAKGEINLRGFYVRRAFRILPPLFVFLATGVVLDSIRPGVELLSSVFLFRNYIPSSLAGHATGHLWSLSIEEHFYLIWPALLTFAAIRKNSRSVAYLAIAAGLWRIADMENGFTASLFADLPQHFRTDRRLDALLWGGFAAFLLNDAKTAAWIRERAQPGWLAAGIALAVTGAVIYSGLAGLWLAMLLPLLLLLTLLHPEWRFSRILDARPVSFVGRISYSLYLWQQLFLVPGWSAEASWWTAFPINLALAFAAAIASYYLIEKPCMNYGRKLAVRLRSSFQPGDRLGVVQAQ
jgi:peptidoglycan/LPS O-acetylase OafA/YrhL